MATLLSPDMLPEDIRNMDFGQASMPHAPEAQTPEVPYDTTTSAPDRPAIPLSPDMLSGNLRGNDSEKSGIEFSFDAFGYTQQVELVRESYADGNLAVTAYLSDPTDESFGQPWSSVTVNFGSPLQQDATVFLDTNNMGEAMLSKISQLGAFTGQFMRSGFCSYPAFTFDTEVMDNMRDLNEFVSADHSSLALVGSIKAFECPSLRVLHAPLILPLEVQKLFLKICRFRSRIDQTVQQCQCPVPHRPVKRLLDGIPQKPHVLLLDFLLAHIHPFSSAVRTASPCHTSFVPRSRVRTRNGR